jgi:hypothetical protein
MGFELFLSFCNMTTQKSVQDGLTDQPQKLVQKFCARFKALDKAKTSNITAQDADAEKPQS